MGLTALLKQVLGSAVVRAQFATKATSGLPGRLWAALKDGEGMHAHDLSKESQKELESTGKKSEHELELAKKQSKELEVKQKELEAAKKESEDLQARLKVLESTKKQSEDLQERLRRLEVAQEAAEKAQGITPPQQQLVDWLDTNLSSPPSSFEELQQTISELPVSKRTALYLERLLRKVPTQGWFTPEPPANTSYTRPDFVKFMLEDTSPIQIYVALRRIGKSYGGPHAVITTREQLNGRRDVAYLYYAGMGLGAEFVNALPTIITVLAYLHVPIILDEFQLSPDIITTIRAFMSTQFGAAANFTPFQVVLFGSNQEAIYEQGRTIFNQARFQIRRIPNPPLELLQAMMLRHPEYQALNDAQKAELLVSRVGFGGPDISVHMQLVTHTSVKDFKDAGPRILTYLSNEQLTAIFELLMKKGQGRDADQRVLQDLIHLRLLRRVENQPGNYTFLDPRLIVWQELTYGDEATETGRIHTALGYLLESMVREEFYLRDLLLTRLEIQGEKDIQVAYGNYGRAELDYFLYVPAAKVGYLCSIKYSEDKQDLRQSFLNHVKMLVHELKADIVEMLLEIEKLVLVRVSLVPVSHRDPWEQRYDDPEYKSFRPDFQGSRENKKLGSEAVAALESKKAERPTWVLEHKRVLIHELLQLLPKWPAPIVHNPLMIGG